MFLLQTLVNLYCRVKILTKAKFNYTENYVLGIIVQFGPLFLKIRFKNKKLYFEFGVWFLKPNLYVLCVPFIFIGYPD